MVNTEAGHLSSHVPCTLWAARLTLPFLLGAVACVSGCANVYWDAKDHILMSEASQVKLRSVQTLVFDTPDKSQVLKAALNVMQDLFFHVDVLDEELGVVSGKKFYGRKGGWKNNASYYNYQTDALMIFSSIYRTEGPFRHREDLTRMTVTVRPRGEGQLLVRASIQYDMNAIDDPKVYQTFFKLLRQSLFLASEGR